MGYISRILQTNLPKMNGMQSVGVIFITHYAEKHIPNCLPPILASPLKPRVLVVNSSSGDQTIQLAQAMGAETLLIPRKEFNHGTTREKARKYLQTPIVVMMTPDAYAEDAQMLEKLVEPLQCKRASVSYARQIPHLNASSLESISREFNYPSKSQLRSFQDVETLGPYAYFCSNACAAYLNTALDDAGGFPEVLFGEDTCAVAAMLKKGHSIYYASEAVVRHSHHYALKQEFKRHFDIGLSRHKNSALLFDNGSDYKKGQAFARAYLKQVIRQFPHLTPYAITQLATKWFGYRLGAASLNAPLWFKRLFSSQDFYWI